MFCIKLVVKPAKTCKPCWGMNPLPARKWQIGDKKVKNGGNKR
jgi:hypothetical protein